MAALACVAKDAKQIAGTIENFAFADLFEEIVGRVSNDALNEDNRAFFKIQMVNIIGLSREKILFPFLNNMLLDQSDAVVNAAIYSISQTGSDEFIRILIQYLKKKKYRKAAREALADYGEKIIDYLIPYLNNPGLDQKLSLEVPGILARIGSQTNVDVILEHLPQENPFLEFFLIKTLNKLRARFSTLKFNRATVEQLLFAEIDQFLELASVLLHLDKSRFKKPEFSLEFHTARKLLKKSIHEDLDFKLTKIFRFLGLIYPAMDVYNAYLGVTHTNKTRRANAIEFIDNMLSGILRYQVMNILERPHLKEAVLRSKYSFNLNLRESEKLFTILLKKNESWLSICAVHFITLYRKEKQSLGIQILDYVDNEFVREIVEKNLA